MLRVLNKSLLMLKPIILKTQVRKYIEWMKDSKLLTRVAGVNFSAEEVRYHAYCRIKYQAEAQGKVNQKQSLAGKNIPNEESTSFSHKQREIHNKLFEERGFVKKTSFS